MQKNSPSVQVGDRVNSGTHIGNVGSSGNSTGDHLHIEIYTPQNNYNDHKLQKNPNPANYMPGLKP